MIVVSINLMALVTAREMALLTVPPTVAVVEGAAVVAVVAVALQHRCLLSVS
jgi:putative effector of murein hydrolase LrgA (UPF0299 family)